MTNIHHLNRIDHLYGLASYKSSAPGHLNLIQMNLSHRYVCLCWDFDCTRKIDIRHKLFNNQSRLIVNFYSILFEKKTKMIHSMFTDLQFEIVHLLYCFVLFCFTYQTK